MRPNEHHRFKSNRQTWTEEQSASSRTNVWHLRAFVHLVPDAMPCILTRHMEAIAFHVILYRRRNITCAIAFTHKFNACKQCAFGDFKQFCCLGRYLPYSGSESGVCNEIFMDRTAIYRND